MQTTALKERSFLFLTAGTTIAFLWILSPFFGAIMWAVTLALLFYPLNRWLLRRLHWHATPAALATLAACVFIVVVPIILLGSSIAADILSFVHKVHGGEINYAHYYYQVLTALPPWATAWVERLNVINPQALLDKLSSGLLQGGQLVASRALAAGQNTFQFLVDAAIMLYLVFFLLRDGSQLARLLRRVAPLKRAHTHFLMHKFATVVRATVKGNIVIAAVQGLLGGLAFAVLGIGAAAFWGVVMAVLSLLPAIGAALVWGPAAIYLIATHAVWQGVALVVWGVVAIGLSDNILRPILVGKDTQMPDYVVLISTIGGMALLGISGFVIGPTVAAMFMACWALFENEIRHSRRHSEHGSERNGERAD